MTKHMNTIIGAALVGLLFWWASYNGEVQQREARDAAAAQLLEKQLADSLAAIKNTNPNATPELVAATPNLQPEIQIDGPSKSEPALAAVSVPDSIIKALPAQIVRRTVAVETDKFVVTIDNQGALVRSLVLKSLPSPEGTFPELISDQELGALGIKFDKSDFSTAMFSFPTDLPDHNRVENQLSVVLQWIDAQGRKVLRTYSFTKDGMDFRVVTKVEGFRPELYTLEWRGGMRETEPFFKGKSFGPMGYFFSEVALNNGYNVERHPIADVKEKKWFNRDQGKARWVGLRRKYVAAVINWDGESEASIGAERLKTNVEGDEGTFQLSINDNMQSDSVAFRFVVLPLVHNQIEALGESYEKIMFSGWEWLAADKWFVWLCGVILRLLNIFYSMIPNYGVAIILLTLLVKLATLPFTLKQMKSTKEMMLHKPALDDIRARNRSTPQKANQEIMAYYAKNGVNPFAPMAGCLTMILQMPVFIGLFVVLGRAVELRYAPFMLWIEDLSKPDVITTALTIPYLMPMGIAILPFIMTVTTYFQTKQTVTDPNQKAMIYMMPAMMFFFSGVMPSGLVLYWIVSNLFGIVQYWAINTKNKKTPAVTVHKK